MMERLQPVPFSLRTLRAFLLIAVSLVTYAALALPLSLRPAALPLEVGDVAPHNMQAPRDFEYVSQVRTQEAQAAAEKSVQPVYTAPDPAIARQQINRLSSALQYISLIRLDTETSPEDKKAKLAAMTAVTLKSESIQQILSMSDLRWSLVQQEAIRVLELVMRGPVRADNLDFVKKDVASHVSLTLNEQDAALVTELVGAFVISNSEYSQDLTTAAQQSAREAVQPVVESYKAGETIVSGGSIITPAQMEALQEFGLIRSEQPAETYLSVGALTILSAVFVALYFYRRPSIKFLSDARSLLVVAFIFLVFLVTARLVVPNRTIVPYAYPLPAIGLLLTALFGMDVGIILSFIACILAAYGLPNALDLMPYYLLSTLFGVVMLGSARRFWSFFGAGMAIAGAGLAMILAYRLTSGPIDWIGLATAAGAPLFNGLASGGLGALTQ